MFLNKSCKLLGWEISDSEEQNRILNRQRRYNKNNKWNHDKFHNTFRDRGESLSPENVK